MHQRIRIKDIAAQTGVSIGTVDRVLHNRGHVSADVRVRVLRVMEEMGYQYWQAARPLFATLGLLTETKDCSSSGDVSS